MPLTKKLEDCVTFSHSALELPFVVSLFDKLFKRPSFCYPESIDSKLSCLLCKFNNFSLISLFILMTLNIFLGSKSKMVFTFLLSPFLRNSFFVIYFIVVPDSPSSSPFSRQLSTFNPFASIAINKRHP